jgi:hypothetical protein
MSDKDTQAKGKFEPPPWEREAFDALAARRAEEQQAADLLAVAAAAAGQPGDAAVLAAEEPALTPADVAPDTVGASAAAAPATPETPATPAVSVDDKAVQAMLAQLQMEERSDSGAATWVGWVSASVTLLLGAAVLVFGILSLRGAEGNVVKLLGSGVLSIFGLCFMGMAVWVWVRTNRSRGRS